MRAEEAVKKLEENEGKSVWEIWKDSTDEDREYGYIISDRGVKKIIGSRKSFRVKPWEIPDNSIILHTHPFRRTAELSTNDVVFLLYRTILNNLRGFGVIAGDEVKIWYLPEDVAKELYNEREKIRETWEKAYLEGDADLCFSCRAKVAANTKKVRKELKLMYVKEREKEKPKFYYQETLTPGKAKQLKFAVTTPLKKPKEIGRQERRKETKQKKLEKYKIEIREPKQKTLEEYGYSNIVGGIAVLIISIGIMYLLRRGDKWQ